MPGKGFGGSGHGFRLLISLIAGITTGDMRGQLGFGLLLGCALLAVSVAIALRAPEVVLRVMRMAWIGMAIFVLIVAIIFDGEAGDTVLTYAMVALNFPLSLLSAPLAGSLLGGLTKQTAGLVMLWLALLGVGYLQWFVLLDWLCRKNSR
ncbi:MAG: hypothetical protein KA024_02820 [Zoogloea sp.]|nr:hypothetical protein [Zoogloea sp.]